MVTEIIILIILLLLSAFFSGAEIALFSISNIKLHALVKTNIKGAKEVQKLKSDPKKLLATILVGNNIVNIVAASIASVVAYKLSGSTGASIAAGIMTILILIFGEITPKSIAHKHAELIALKTIGIMQILVYLLSPITYLLGFITGFVTKVGGTKKATFSEEEIKAILETSAAEGSIRPEERERIERLFQFNDITAKEVMTPRTQMVSLESSIKLKDALHLLSDIPFTRIPLHKKIRDNIVGILNVKDILEYVEKNKLNVTLGTISTRPYFIPEGKLIDQLFKEFQERRIHMAIVVDEFGGTAGIVTMEDLLEEIFGDIVDEKGESKNPIIKIDKNTIKVDGQAELDDINSFFNVKLPGKNKEKVNAFILKRLKRIPKKGEEIKLDNLTIIIDKASKKRVKSAILTKAISS